MSGRQKQHKQTSKPRLSIERKPFKPIPKKTFIQRTLNWFTKNKSKTSIVYPRKNDCTFYSNILCRLAVSDAYHDFGNDDSVAVHARNNLPSASAQCVAYKEPNKFLEKEFQAPLYKGLYRFNNDNIYLKNYVSYDVDENTLLSTLRTVGINKIYFVVDTYRTAFSNALEKANQESGIDMYWIQNNQTMFDPATKTIPTSSSGKKIFKNKIIKFGYENTNQFDKYPSWDKDCVSVNSKFFTKNEVTLYKYNKGNSYESHASFAVINKDGKYILFDSTMAARTTPLMQTDFIKSVCRSLDEYIYNANYKAVDYLQEDKLLAKRLGDQSQALSCMKSSFTLDIPIEKKTITTESIYHSFVTIDALAMSAAIIYNTPIIIYCYPSKEGETRNMSLLIRNDIISVENRERYLETIKAQRRSILESEFIEINEKYNIIREDLINKIDTIIDDLIKNIVDFPEFITIEADDTQDKIEKKANAYLAYFLWQMYSYIFFLRLKSNVNFSFLEKMNLNLAIATDADINKHIYEINGALELHEHINKSKFLKSDSPFHLQNPKTSIDDEFLKLRVFGSNIIDRSNESIFEKNTCSIYIRIIYSFLKRENVKIGQMFFDKLYTYGNAQYKQINTVFSNEDATEKTKANLNYIFSEIFRNVDENFEDVLSTNQYVIMADPEEKYKKEMKNLCENVFLDLVDNALLNKNANNYAMHDGGGVGPTQTYTMMEPLQPNPRETKVIHLTLKFPKEIVELNTKEKILSNKKEKTARHITSLSRLELFLEIDMVLKLLLKLYVFAKLNNSNIKNDELFYKQFNSIFVVEDISNIKRKQEEGTYYFDLLKYATINPRIIEYKYFYILYNQIVGTDLVKSGDELAENDYVEFPEIDGLIKAYNMFLNEFGISFTNNKRMNNKTVKNANKIASMMGGLSISKTKRNNTNSNMRSKTQHKKKTNANKSKPQRKLHKRTKRRH
jgi:hypothetical protein